MFNLFIVFPNSRQAPENWEIGWLSNPSSNLLTHAHNLSQGLIDLILESKLPLGCMQSTGRRAQSNLGPRAVFGTGTTGIPFRRV